MTPFVSNFHFVEILFKKFKSRKNTKYVNRRKPYVNEKVSRSTFTCTFTQNTGQHFRLSENWIMVYL